MTGQLELREVTSADVPEVIAHVAEVLAEFGLSFGIGTDTDDQLRHLPQSYVDGGGVFWIARAGGVIVGTCGVFPVGGSMYELRKMYLRPRSRGLGLGKRLLDLAVEWTRARGGTQLVLDTIEGMTAAIAFYESHGFVRDDAQMRGARCTRGYRRDL